MKNLLVALAATVALVLVASSFYAGVLSRQATLEQTLRDLDEVRHLNTRLDREVLMLLTGQHFNFDALADDISRLQHGVNTTATSETLKQATIRKLASAERFKTHVAILRNAKRASIRHTTELLSEAQLSDIGTGAQGTSLGTSKALLTNTLIGDTQSMQALRDSLTQIGKASSTDPRWARVAAHLRVIIKSSNGVSSALGEIVDASLPDAIAADRAATAQAYESNRSRTGLWQTALMALAGLAILIGARVIQLMGRRYEADSATS